MEENSMQNKVVVPGKVEKDRTNNRKFKIAKDKTNEVDAYVEIVDDPKDAGITFVIDKLSVDGLPITMHDGTAIRWFNNFAIRRNTEYINQRYFVTIAGLSASKVVIFDGNGDPYYYTGAVTNDTIELTDGDPAVGAAP
jgi:hypothetical protein